MSSTIFNQDFPMITTPALHPSVVYGAMALSIALYAWHLRRTIQRLSDEEKQFKGKMAMSVAAATCVSVAVFFLLATSVADRLASGIWVVLIQLAGVVHRQRLERQGVDGSYLRYLKKVDVFSTSSSFLVWVLSLLAASVTSNSSRDLMLLSVLALVGLSFAVITLVFRTLDKK